MFAVGTTEQSLGLRFSPDGGAASPEFLFFCSSSPEGIFPLIFREDGGGGEAERGLDVRETHLLLVASRARTPQPGSGGLGGACNPSSVPSPAGNRTRGPCSPPAAALPTEPHQPGSRFPFSLPPEPPPCNLAGSFVSVESQAAQTWGPGPLFPGGTAGTSSGDLERAGGGPVEVGGCPTGPWQRADPLWPPSPSRRT